MQKEDVVGVEEKTRRKGGEKGRREEMSLKKMMKSRGPRIDPWGTPEVTGDGRDFSEPILTDWE